MAGNGNSRPIGSRLASIFILMSACSGAIAQPVDELEMVRFVNKEAALAQAAIAKCDYDEYVNLKRAYDLMAPTAGRFKPALNAQIKPFPPYPFPCLEVATPRTTTRVAAAPTHSVTTRGVEAWRWTPYLSVLGGGTAGRTEFDVTPPFNAPGNNGFLETNIGLRTGVSGTAWMFGARLGIIGGPSGSAKFYPASGFDYSVRHQVTGIGEVTFGNDGIDFGDIGLQRVNENNRLAFEGAFGVAVGSREVVARMPGFDLKDTTTDFGLTAALRVQTPITPYLSALAQARYLHSFQGAVNIPGPVNIESNIWYFGAGVSINLSPPPPRVADRYPVM